MDVKQFSRLVTSVCFDKQCAKQTVIAFLITTTRHIYIASNWCQNPQQECPRKEMPTGQGYELCQNICQQQGHAEIQVLKLAGEEARGSSLFLIGHYYLCDNCTNALLQAGVEHVLIVGDFLLTQREKVIDKKENVIYNG